MDWPTALKLGIPLLAEWWRNRRRSPKVPVSPAIPAAPPPRPILLVEDDSNDAVLIMRAISGEGSPCDWTESGDHALMLISKTAYRMCIIDIGLRVGMNGYALAKEIRKEHPLMPIWLTTGSQDNLFCVEPGIALGLVLKSVRWEAFIDAVKMTPL